LPAITSPHAATIKATVAPTFQPTIGSPNFATICAAIPTASDEGMLDLAKGSHPKKVFVKLECSLKEDAQAKFKSYLII
jgi:hypothetical protein